jgi:bisphosphoglycerate-dependent phosphoglycerate mutase
VKNPNTEPASELLKRIQAEKQQLIKDKKIKAQKPLSVITEDETIRTAPKYIRKISETDAKSIQLTHVYMTTHQPDFV